MKISDFAVDLYCCIFHLLQFSLSLIYSNRWYDNAVGDVVTVGQCRPLAKTVRFNVLEHFPSANKVHILSVSSSMGICCIIDVSRCMQSSLCDFMMCIGSLLSHLPQFICHLTMVCIIFPGGERQEDLPYVLNEKHLIPCPSLPL